MIFKRAVQRYGRTPEPATPYQRAGQVWDERIGSARVQARNWRLMAFGCLALSGGLTSGLVWQSVQNNLRLMTSAIAAQLSETNSDSAPVGKRGKQAIDSRLQNRRVIAQL